MTSARLAALEFAAFRLLKAHPSRRGPSDLVSYPTASAGHAGAGGARKCAISETISRNICGAPRRRPSEKRPNGRGARCAELRDRVDLGLERARLYFVRLASPRGDQL